MTSENATRHARRLLALLVAVFVVAACTTTPADGPARASAEGGPTRAAPPTSGPVRAVCGAVPPGPAAPPAGAVVVDPAVNDGLAVATLDNPPGTTFWLAPGTHTLSPEEYAQVIPKDGNTYLGAPGAVLDGQDVNLFAFTQTASRVTIRFLTIQGFEAGPDEGVVNHDSGDDWVIEHNTIQNNGGAAMMAGARQQVRGNCLRDNGQYAINAFKAGNTITGLVVEGNEITGNNTDDWEGRLPGCGCTGGVKFWAVDGADIRHNWVHDNRGTGLWADMNNNDLLIEENLIENNDGEAIFYEASYNAIIRNNTIRNNTWVAGREFADRGDDFPVAAIYISEAGGEPRLPARTDKIEIYGNVLENNWSGITAWENADRFCNSPANPNSDCPRLLAAPAQCAAPAITSEPLYGDCRWKTQRLDIHDNQFVLDTELGCAETYAGRMAVFANYGTYPDWSPYMADVIRDAITFGQENTWRDNTYVGPWTFVAYDSGRSLSIDEWRSEPYGQDVDSAFTGNSVRAAC